MRGLILSATLLMSCAHQTAKPAPAKPRPSAFVIELPTGDEYQPLLNGPPQTLGFLFMAVAGLIISVVILRSQALDKGAGYVGIVGFAFALSNYVARLTAPSIAAILMPINGLLWLIWWLMMSVSLLKLTRAIPEKEPEKHMVKT